MKKKIIRNSHQINEVRYNEKTSKMYVRTTDNEWYEYDNVPPERYVGIENDQSPGNYYSSKILNNYTCRQLQDEPPEESITPTPKYINKEDVRKIHISGISVTVIGILPVKAIDSEIDGGTLYVGSFNETRIVLNPVCLIVSEMSKGKVGNNNPNTDPNIEDYDDMFRYEYNTGNISAYDGYCYREYDGFMAVFFYDLVLVSRGARSYELMSIDCWEDEYEENDE